MLRVAEPTDQRIYFELDRFEPCGDHRVAITGRWYGVRGRRFVRPTLSMRTDRGRCRALADLEHKPWAAEDGQPWRADFRVDEDASQLLEAELAVAPDIEIALPVHGAPAGERIPAPRRDAVRVRVPTATSTASAPARPELDRLRDELASARAQVERLSAELRDAVAEREQGRSELDRAQALLERLRSERDWAQRAANEAAQLRDAALGDLDAAHAARDEAVAQRKALSRQLATLQNEHDQLSSAYGAGLLMHNSTVARRSELYWVPRLAAVVVVVAAVIAAVLTHVL